VKRKVVHRKTLIQPVISNLKGEKSLESLYNSEGDGGERRRYRINNFGKLLLKLAAVPRPAFPVAGVRIRLEQIK